MNIRLMNHKTVRMCVMVLALVLGAAAYGEIILVDFGPSTGEQGSPDGNGNNWNNVSSLSGLENLMPVTGSQPTTIDISMTGWDGFNTWNSGLTPDANLNGGLFAFTDVTDDGAYFTASQAPTLTLSGLDLTMTYDLIFYGARRDSERYTTYSVAGAGSVELQTGDDPGWNSDTVVSFTGLSPDGSGNIAVDHIAWTGTGQTGSRTFGYLNALEIETHPIPEPGTLALLGLGACGLFLRKRRRV